MYKEPGRLQSIGSQRVGYNWSGWTHMQLYFSTKISQTRQPKSHLSVASRWAMVCKENSVWSVCSVSQAWKNGDQVSKTSPISSHWFLLLSHLHFIEVTFLPLAPGCWLCVSCHTHTHACAHTHTHSYYYASVKRHRVCELGIKADIICSLELSFQDVPQLLTSTNGLGLRSTANLKWQSSQ